MVRMRLIVETFGVYHRLLHDAMAIGIVLMVTMN